MKQFSVEDIQEVVKGCKVTGNTSIMFDDFKPVVEASKNHVSWLRPGIKNSSVIINKTNAGCIICSSEDFNLYTGSPDNILFIITENPQFVFAKLVKHFNERETKGEPYIHPTAIVHAGCKVGLNVSIGAYSIVGACDIGNGTVIHEHVKISNDVEIGKDCVIREFCSIGGEGFGIVKDEEGNNMHMSHIGKVVIKDNVLIFPYSNVDRATLGETLIDEYTVIDHYCHIGHNVRIGKNNIITAGVIFAGGSKIGDNCYIGVNTAVKQKVEIGSNVTTGMGSVITHNIPDNETWLGNPAAEISSFVKAKDFIKKNSQKSGS